MENLSLSHVTADEFSKQVNQLRKAHPDKWYTCTAIVEGKTVGLKGFNTWLQIFRVDRIQQNTLSDISVKQFIASLLEPFNR